MRPRVIYKSYIEQAFIRGSSTRDIKLNALFVSRRVWHWHTWRVMRRTCPVQCHTQPLERQRKIYIPDIDSAVFPLSLIAFVADDIRMRTKIWHKGIEVPGKRNSLSRFLEQSISISRPHCILLLFASHVHARSTYICVSVERGSGQECRRVISFPLGPRS